MEVFVSFFFLPRKKHGYRRHKPVCFDPFVEFGLRWRHLADANWPPGERRMETSGSMRKQCAPLCALLCTSRNSTSAFVYCGRCTWHSVLNVERSATNTCVQVQWLCCTVRSGIAKDPALSSFFIFPFLKGMGWRGGDSYATKGNVPVGSTREVGAYNPWFYAVFVEYMPNFGSGSAVNLNSTLCIHLFINMRQTLEWALHEDTWDWQVKWGGNYLTMSKKMYLANWETEGHGVNDVNAGDRRWPPALEKDCLNPLLVRWKRFQKVITVTSSDVYFVRVV